MRPLKRITIIKMHGLQWLYYKTIMGDYRYIAPVSGDDCGPFKTFKGMRDYIRTWGNNINWQ